MKNNNKTMWSLTSPSLKASEFFAQLNKNNKYFVRYRLDNDTEDYIILDLSYTELNEDAIASKIRQSRFYSSIEYIELLTVNLL